MTSGHPCPRPLNIMFRIILSNTPQCMLRCKYQYIYNIVSRKNVFNIPYFYRSHSTYLHPSKNAAGFRKTNSQCGPAYWVILLQYVV